MTIHDLYLAGCPPSLRKKLWRVAMGLPADEAPREALEYERLVITCHQYDLITDELFLRDIQTVTDDPRFFVFEVRTCSCAAAFYHHCESSGRVEGGHSVLQQGPMGAGKQRLRNTQTHLRFDGQS